MADDEEYKGPVGHADRSGQLRPSMVVMTSKLLNVSEGIAAMNLRIAAGVAFLCVLLVATFIVNIMAFEYAKDSESNGRSLVDKDSGKTLSVQPVLEYDGQPVFSVSHFFATEATKTAVRNGFGQYTLLAKEVRACGEAFKDDDCCMDGRQAWLAFTMNPHVVLCGIDDGGLLSLKEASPEFVAAAMTADGEEKLMRRSLLQYYNPEYSGNFPEYTGVSNIPTSYPTAYPTNYPTPPTTDAPTDAPTAYPTPNPTNYPTDEMDCLMNGDCFDAMNAAG